MNNQTACFTKLVYVCHVISLLHISEMTGCTDLLAEPDLPRTQAGRRRLAGTTQPVFDVADQGLRLRRRRHCHLRHRAPAALAAGPVALLSVPTSRTFSAPVSLAWCAQGMCPILARGGLCLVGLRPSRRGRVGRLPGPGTDVSGP